MRVRGGSAGGGRQARADAAPAPAPAASNGAVALSSSQRRLCRTASCCTPAVQGPPPREEVTTGLFPLPC